MIQQVHGQGSDHEQAMWDHAQAGCHQPVTPQKGLGVDSLGTGPVMFE